MAAIRDKTNTVFRDFETIGMPNTGDHEVEKVGVRELGALIEDTITAAATSTVPGVLLAAATTANVTLSGNQTIDGVVNPATILVKNQTDATQNGPYALGTPWTRLTTDDTGAELANKAYLINAGTVNGGFYYKIVNTAPITVGVTTITYQPVGKTDANISGQVSDLDTRLDTLEGSAVRNTGNETIAGTKTFSSAPVVPDSSFTIAKTTGLQTALDAKAPINNATFTGTTVIPTADINGGTVDGITSLGVRSTGAAFDFKWASSEVLTATRTISVNVGDAARSVTFGGNLTLANAFSTSGAFAMTLTATGATNVTLPTTGTLATIGGTETLVGKTLTSPIINTGDINTPDIDGGTADGLTSLGVRSTGAAFDLRIASNEVLTANRNLLINVGDAARGLTFGGNVTLASGFGTSGAFNMTLTATAATNVTLPTSGTLATTGDVDEIGDRAHFYPAGYAGADDRWDIRLLDKDSNLAVGFDLSGGAVIIGDTVIESGGSESGTNTVSGGAPAVISSGDIVATTEDGEITIDGSPWVFDKVAPGNLGIKYSWNKPLIGAKSRGQTDGTYFVPDGPKLTIHNIGYGQSEENGSTSIPPLPAFAVIYQGDWLLMPDVGETSDIRVGRTTSTTTEDVFDPNTIVGLRPIISRAGVASTGYGQTHLESLVRADHDWVMENLGFHQRHVAASWGHGGFPYSDADLAKCLKKGSVAYENMMDGQARLFAIDTAAGYKPVCPGVDLIHGTSNYTVGGYEPILLEWQEDLETDLKALYDQDARIPAYLVQMSSFATDVDDVPLSQLKVHVDDAAVANEYAFVFVTPSYMLNFAADFVHWTAADEALIGEYFHMARLETFYGKTRFEPLRPVSAAQSGNNIDITFTGNVGTLVIDTTLVTERSGTNKGFMFRSSGGDVVPTTVTVQSANVIRCAFAAPPAGTSKVIRYALEGHVGSRTLANMPRGNIRDSNPRLARYDNSKHLYKWAPHFEMTVT